MSIRNKHLEIRVQRGLPMGFCVLLLSSLVALSVYGNDSPFGPITSDSVAVAAAERITGLGEFFTEKGYRLAVDEVVSTTYIDTTTPYIHEQLNGRPAWRVTWSQFEHVIDSVCGVGKRPTPVKICHVWMDSTTGRFLRMVISPSDRVNCASNLPSAEDLQWEVRSRGNRYLGLPEVKPNMSLLESMATCHDYLPHSECTVIQYVVMTLPMFDTTGATSGEETVYTSEPFPAWVIRMTGSGFSKVSAGEDMVSLSSRMVANALTGKVYEIATFKYPKEP